MAALVRSSQRLDAWRRRTYCGLARMELPHLNDAFCQGTTFEMRGTGGILLNPRGWCDSRLLRGELHHDQPRASNGKGCRGFVTERLTAIAGLANHMPEGR
jgi:hypothetical protein